MAAFGDSQATMAGFLQAAAEAGVEVVPLLFTFTDPAGTITADAFERICGEMLDLLRDRGPWDGVLLAQHGAAVSEDFPDMDGEVAARVRALVGPNVPIGMAPDMHANLSQKMVDHTTAIVGYRTNPHLDARERARECADIIVRTIRGEIRPVQALEMPPVVINIVKQFSGEEPMLSIVQDVEDVIRRPGMLSASVAQGYPYADVAEMGMGFLAISDGDESAARTAARWMARRAWDKRAQFVADTPSPEAALRMAMAAEAPVVLMDVGDNIGGGSRPIRRSCSRRRNDLAFAATCKRCVIRRLSAHVSPRGSGDVCRSAWAANPTIAMADQLPSAAPFAPSPMASSRSRHRSTVDGVSSTAGRPSCSRQRMTTRWCSQRA